MKRLFAAAALMLTLSLAGPAQAQKPAQSAALVEAATRGDTAQVEHLLTAGADPDSADKTGLTALNWAAYNGAAGAVRALLAHHARVDSQSNPNGWTPLMNAANNGHGDIVTLLLDAGARPDLRSAAGDTPIWFAAMSNETAVVDLLRRRGATTDVTRIQLAQALCTAARAPMEDKKILWDTLPNGANAADCEAIKHILPGGEGAVVVIYYTLAGDRLGPRTLTLRTHIAADYLPKDQINATLAPVLTSAFTAAGKGAPPADLLAATAALSPLATDTALGRVTATITPGDDPKYPVIGTEYTITITLK